jgi:hypothetical protein
VNDEVFEGRSLGEPSCSLAIWAVTDLKTLILADPLSLLLALDATPST